MAKGGCEVGEGTGCEDGGEGGGGGWESGNHIKFPCYIRHLNGESIDVCLISSVRV